MHLRGNGNAQISKLHRLTTEELGYLTEFGGHDLATATSMKYMYDILIIPHGHGRSRVAFIYTPTCVMMTDGGDLPLV